MYASLLRYKGEALAAHDKLSQALSDSLETKGTQAIQRTVDVGYYVPAARTTLNLLCSSCSSSEIELVLVTPEYSPFGLRRVHYATRLWVCTPRQAPLQFQKFS